MRSYSFSFPAAKPTTRIPSPRPMGLMQAAERLLKAVVWGTRQESVQSLTTWLMKRGMTLVDDVKINQITNDIRMNHTGTTISNADIFKTGENRRRKTDCLYRYGCLHWRTSQIETFSDRPEHLHSFGFYSSPGCGVRRNPMERQSLLDGQVYKLKGRYSPTHVSCPCHSLGTAAARHDCCAEHLPSRAECYGVE